MELFGLLLSFLSPPNWHDLPLLLLECWGHTQQGLPRPTELPYFLTRLQTQAARACGAPIPPKSSGERSLCLSTVATAAPSTHAVSLSFRTPLVSLFERTAVVAAD